MSAPRPLLLPLMLLLLLGAACLAAGSPASARQRRSSYGTLPGGLPLTTVLAICETSGQSEDFGPCLADLLRGAIDAARPNFATGLPFADSIVIEPLKLDDIEPKKDKSFQISVTNLLVHGISTLNINNITFNSEELALNLSFTNVTATSDMKLRYLFLSASPQVALELSNLTVLVHTNYALDVNPDDPSRLDLVLQNATVKFELGDLSISLENLGSAGSLLQRFINANSKVLVNFLVPGLERSVSKKLNSKLNRIKLAD